MQVPIQHMYKPSHEGSGLLYAWFLSMHTRVDIILYSKKTEGELLNRDLHRIAGQIRHGLPELHDCYFIRTTVKFAQSVPE